MSMRILFSAPAIALKALFGLLLFPFRLVRALCDCVAAYIGFASKEHFTMRLRSIAFLREQLQMRQEIAPFGCHTHHIHDALAPLVLSMFPNYSYKAVFMRGDHASLGQLADCLSQNWQEGTTGASIFVRWDPDLRGLQFVLFQCQDDSGVRIFDVTDPFDLRNRLQLVNGLARSWAPYLAAERAAAKSEEEWYRSRETR